MTEILLAFFRNEDGATAIEYGLIAALVCTAAIAGITNVGDGTGEMFNEISDKITNAG